MSITLTLIELRDLIAPVLPHADKGDTLPILECVEFRTRGTWLIATATDRYTVGRCRVKVPEDTEFSCLVNARELKSMLAMFKPGRYDKTAKSITLTIDGALLRVTGASAIFAEATVSYNLYEGEYPKVDPVFADANVTESGDGPWGINGTFMARFNHATRDYQPLTLSRAHPGKPMYVRAGDHFLGAIMPARGVELVTDWLADPTPPVEAAAS